MSKSNFENLSDEIKQFLINLKEDQVTVFHDERGSYVEFDSEKSKPYSSELLLELVELEFLDFHEDSNLSELHEVVESEYDPFSDDDENDFDDYNTSSHGYAFISIQDFFLEFIPNKY